MKTFMKTTRRRETRRERKVAFTPVRMPKPAPRDMIAYAAALDVLG
jgi:hypothetical protein